MQKIVSLCKRRGFIQQSSEIYGGIEAVYDYGPLGVLLKNNLKAAWWRDLVQTRNDIVGLDAAILMNPRVWEASGHVSGFTDPLTECKACHKRFRTDHLIEKIQKSAKLDEHGLLTQEELKDIRKAVQKIKCPECGGQLIAPKEFNLMFETHSGPVEETASKIYLRPETAQGIFVNFKWVSETIRQKLPFGIAQIGKSFRNEITPGNFTFRLREFEQMELEYFVEPGQDEKWFKYWRQARFDWYQKYGINKKNLRLRDHQKNELAHYAKACSDIEYKFPFGWSELEGIANRTDFDLHQHEKFSGQDMKYFDDSSTKSGTRKKYWPYVIEPSGGVDRAVLAFLVDAFSEIDGSRGRPRAYPRATTRVAPTEKDDNKNEIVLRLHKSLAPIKAAVLPLVKNKPKLVKKAQEVYQSLKPHFMCQYDQVGSIGRRYRRQDEIGTPYCITVDFDSLDDNALTIRDRDTMKQTRVKIDDLINLLKEKLS